MSKQAPSSSYSAKSFWRILLCLLIKFSLSYCSYSFSFLELEFSSLVLITALSKVLSITDALGSNSYSNWTSTGFTSLWWDWLSFLLTSTFLLRSRLLSSNSNFPFFLLSFIIWPTSVAMKTSMWLCVLFVRYERILDTFWLLVSFEFLSTNSWCRRSFSPLLALFRALFARPLMWLASGLWAIRREGASSFSTDCSRWSMLFSFCCMLLFISIIWLIRSLSLMVSCLTLLWGP